LAVGKEDGWVAPAQFQVLVENLRQDKARMRGLMIGIISGVPALLSTVALTPRRWVVGS